jgi:Fic family protein
MIVAFVSERGSVSNKEIAARFEISHATAARDLKTLLTKEVLIQEGKGRSVRYRESFSHPLLRFIDPDQYFTKEADDRSGVKERFDSSVLDHLSGLFSKQELSELETRNSAYRSRLTKLPSDIVRREFERLTIDLSWKSSALEGNTYTLLDTETLIKEHQEAPGHTREEAQMILNHKSALDYARDARSEFRTLTISKIGTIHDLIVQNLGITRGLRKTPVGIVGTRYRPLDNEHQIREALEETIQRINILTEPFSKTLIAISLISYIQPFNDGNKRTARMVGDALLLAHDSCPLSFRNMDIAAYKRALILFYEQHSLRLLKEIFIEQFRYAATHYFLTASS